MIADESAEPTMVEESPAMAVMPIVLELIQEAPFEGLVERTYSSPASASRLFKRSYSCKILLYMKMIFRVAPTCPSM